MAANYDSPNWIDNASPAINATNLNDISDTLEDLVADDTSILSTLANYSAVETNAGRVPALINRVIAKKSITVATSAWNSGSPYSQVGYPYYANISISGVTSAYIGFVNFAPADAISGIFAPICVTGANTVTIYAASAPGATVTIPSILCVSTATIS